MNATIAFLGMAVVVLVLDFLAFSKRKMTASVGLIWFLFVVVLIVIAVLPMGSDWRESYSIYFQVPNMMMCGFFVLGLFISSMSISMLQIKNRELAMQVSLLNQENEQILRRLDALEKEKTL